MPVKVIDGVWDFLFGSPNVAHRRYRGARHPVRGGQRREDHQHEHRADRAAEHRARRRGGDQVRRRQGRVHRHRRRQRIRGRQPARGHRRDCLARAGRRLGRGGRSQPGRTPSTRRRPAGSNWPRRADRRAASAPRAPSSSRRSIASFTDTFLLPPSQYRAPRFDVLAYVGYRARRWRRHTSPAWRRC